MENDLNQVSPPFEILTRKSNPEPKWQGRQEEDEDDDGPSTTPYIPMIIPGLTKIFNGIVTGNLNEIFHGKIKKKT